MAYNVGGDAIKIKKVAVTVLATATSGVSAADPELASTVGNVTILGIHSTGNQDQHVDNVTIAADGAVTVTLAAAATANNTFSVSVAVKG